MRLRLGADESTTRDRLQQDELHGSFGVFDARSVISAWRSTAPGAHLPQAGSRDRSNRELVELITLVAIVVEPTETVDIVRDPDDNRLIEAAMAGHADILVSGDQDLLTLQAVGNIRIMTPRDFLAVGLPPS
jgi:hypothetical protein